jgi:hypothetical protein
MACCFTAFLVPAPICVLHTVILTHEEAFDVEIGELLGWIALLRMNFKSISYAVTQDETYYTESFTN